MAEQASLENLPPEEQKRLAAIQLRLLNDPKTRRQALELIQSSTGEQIPELAIYSTEEKLREEFNGKLGEKDKEIQEMKLRNNRDSIISALIEEGVVASRKEFEEVEKFGVENKIADYRSAARFYNMQAQSAEPSGAPISENFEPGRPPEIPDLKKFGGNIQAAAQAEAFRALADLRSGKVKLPQ